MIFYHGSKQIIETPIQGGSKHSNDYGPSFYITDSYMNAKLWACKNNSVGFVNKYYVRNDIYKTFKVLDLTDLSKYSVLNWIAILVHFRDIGSNFKHIYSERLLWLEKFYIDVSEFDIVIGYRADDAYFKFPLEFLTDRLSYEDLLDVFKLGNLGKQYAFMSQRAINSLKFIDSKECDESFVGRYYSLVDDATKTYKEIISRPTSVKKTYLMGMMKDEIK